MSESKQIRPRSSQGPCGFCGRSLLLGEYSEVFISPSGAHGMVCELCIPQAIKARWVREAGDNESPVMAPPVRRVSHRADRFRVALGLRPNGSGGPRHAQRVEGAEPSEKSRRDEREIFDPVVEVELDRERDVHAVPTTGEMKLVRALELFNRSQFRRSVSGLSRSLGSPQIAVDVEGPTTVLVVVAWDITWYCYSVDLTDSTEPVAMLERGDDMNELAERNLEWNAQALADGTLVLGGSDGGSV